MLPTLTLNYNRSALRSHSQLALQRHGRVYALSERGAAVVQRGHFGVNQAAAGVSLQWPRFPILGRWHSRLVHTIKLDCDQRKARNEAFATQTCCTRLKNIYQQHTGWYNVQKPLCLTDICTVVVKHESSLKKQKTNSANQGCVLTNMHKHTGSLSACHSTEGHVHKSIAPCCVHIPVREAHACANFLWTAQEGTFGGRVHK